MQAPTLLLSGGHSLRMFQLVVQELARCLPNNEHVRLADSSHDIPGDAPEAFDDIVLGFLARHRSETAGAEAGTTPVPRPTAR